MTEDTPQTGLICKICKCKYYQMYYDKPANRYFIACRDCSSGFTFRTVLSECCINDLFEEEENE